MPPAVDYAHITPHFAVGYLHRVPQRRHLSEVVFGLFECASPSQWQ